jgi:hypothetical protein
MHAFLSSVLNIACCLPCDGMLSSEALENMAPERFSFDGAKP